MAVQAQSSSNILLLNRPRFPCRTIQEQKSQIGNHHVGAGELSTTVLDHQSLNHTLFNNYPVGNYSIKRRREDNMIMNHFMSNVHQQSQSNQFMDVSQIQSRNVDVSTGLRLAFNDHHQQQQHHSIDPQSSGFVSPRSSEDLSNLINQQRDEIEHYLQAQADDLRHKLAYKRQQHYHALIIAAKESASRIIREKEVVVAKGVCHHAELEARALQLSAEAQVWQAKARAQEAVAIALQAQLQQAIVTGSRGCDTQGEVAAAGDAEDAESSYIDPERVVVVSGPGCKACGKRVASVVLLPCRHLCVCSVCDDVVQACPLCLSLRSSSIEVYMS